MREPHELAKTFHELHKIAENLRRMERGVITNEGCLEYTVTAYKKLEGDVRREVDKLIRERIEEQLDRARKALTASLQGGSDVR